MAIYPLLAQPSFSYADHLMYNQYVGDINRGLERILDKNTSKVIESYSASSQILSETNEKNSAVLESITSELSDNIIELTNIVEYGLEQVASGINSLRADFDIAMGKVLLQFEMLRNEFRSGYSHIINILENRRKVEAREHFQDALEFYRDGCRFLDKPQWFNDALNHFLASVEIYERNPLAHLHIAHIYHYQRDFQDFEKALKHYRLCYTYGEVNKNEHVLVAQGYFYAGWLCIAVFKDIKEAVKLTNNALKFDPSLSEAYYHLAKFYAIRKESELSIKNLKQAIVEFDKKYCLKALADPDFDIIREEVNNLFQELREDAKLKFQNAIEKFDWNFDPKDCILREWLQEIRDKIFDVENKDTYYAYADALPNVKRWRSDYKRVMDVATYSAQIN